MQKLFLLALAIPLLSACKKDSENAPSRLDLLTTPTWRVTAQTETITLSRAGSTPTVTVFDRYAGMAACERDNFFKFNADNSRDFNEGLSKCIPTDPQLGTTNWYFSIDQTKLLLPSPQPFTIAEHDILELTSSTLRVSSTDITNTSTGSSSDVIETTFTAF